MLFYNIISSQQTPFLVRCIKIEKCVIDKYETISSYQICSSKRGGKTPTKYNDNLVAHSYAYVYIPKCLCVVIILKSMAKIKYYPELTYTFCCTVHCNQSDNKVMKIDF